MRQLLFSASQKDCQGSVVNLEGLCLAAIGLKVTFKSKLSFNSPFASLTKFL